MTSYSVAMLDQTTLFISAGALLLSGVLSGAMALGRGRDGAVWFLIGCAFGPLAIIALALFGKRPG